MENIQDSLVSNLVKNTNPPFSVSEAKAYIMKYKADVFVLIILLLEFDLLLQKYMLKIEEKWSSLCNQVELTSNSDKAFAKLIVELYCDEKRFNYHIRDYF